MVWKLENPQGNESAKIKWELVPYTRGKTLDLGCGPYKTFPHFIGVDNGHHDKQFGWQNKADLIIDSCERLDLIASQSVDAVFSSHLLEHIENTEKALKEWFRVIKIGGYLCLYLPHKEFYPNIGEAGSNPDHKHDFLPQDIIDIMQSIKGWELVENQERNDDEEYSFFQVYKKRSDKKNVINIKQRPNKSCALIRYGAFGDMIMASSVFPALKAQGYHLTVFCVPTGYDIAKNDPHIDEFVIQGRDQVPNADLGQYWEYLETKYDKVINLSESIEGTLLAMQGRINNTWPDSVRRKELNKNYLEWTHQIAEVPFPIKQNFYPTEEENIWAKKERAALGSDSFVIMWSLSGSGLHKTWPHIDACFARLMIEHKHVKIILVGDATCQILEQGWENEKRVICKSGKYSIRESMALAKHVDLVVGPETGLLNCVGMETLPKVILLSHSTIENLTKHWINTDSIEPTVPCYPCHRLHYGFKHCFQNEESGTSECMHQTGVDVVYNAIDKRIQEWPHLAA